MTPSSRVPVPLRSPTTRGDPSRIRATSCSSCAVSLFSASTFCRTLTIRRVSSRRATRSKHSPRSPCGRERKNPVFASPRRVSSRTRSRFIGHSSCGLLYKFLGMRPPGIVRADTPANPLSRSRPSPSFMAGELVGDRVIVDCAAEGSAVYNRGIFGSPRAGGGLELNLLEAVYLVEGGRLDVRRRGRAVSSRELFRAASASIEAFEIRYLVYRDLRARGYVVEARGGPVDFQVYPRGGAPKKTPSKYWVRALSERAVFDLAELLGRAEEAAAVRKTLLLGLVDEESDLTYYSVREAHPRGHQPATLRKVDVVVHFLGDRAVVIDEVQAKALHEAGFFGKIVGRRLQLSLLETAYLLKAGLVEVRNADTDRPISLARLIKEAKAIQTDIELRLKAYEDLTGRGVISKTGFKYGSHFRAYEGDPETHNAKYLVHVVPKGHRGAWPEISRAVRLAHGVKKQILFDEVGDGVRYVKMERIRP